MMKTKVLISVLFIAAFAAVALGQRSTAAGTVRTLLTYEDKPHGATFNQQNLNRYKKWITPELYRLFKVALAREKRYIRLHPTNKPYFGDGMDFGPLKENCNANGRVYPQQFSIRKAVVSGTSATVRASFFWNKACGIDEPTIFRFKLVRRKSGWLIDDIDYRSNGGTLRTDLLNAPKS